MTNKILLEPTLLDEAMEEIAAAKCEMEIAVDKILMVAEGLIARDNASNNADAESLEADCFAIFEACAFQDMTGQRLSKAIKKIEQAKALYDVKPQKQTRWANAPTVASLCAPSAKSDEEGLLNGPPLPGEGLDQDAVNLLLKDGNGN